MIFCDYAYDVAPYSLSLWQRLSAIKVELELELQTLLDKIKPKKVLTATLSLCMDFNIFITNEPVFTYTECNFRVKEFVKSLSSYNLHHNSTSVSQHP